jgi:transcriptional regulator with XRE-family HTH domain
MQSGIMMPARMDNHASTLGGLLRDARERLGRRNGVRVRQADVAEHVDITIEWYARIERGGVLPSFDVLSRIATVLELSSQERVEALRFIVPEFLAPDAVEAMDITGRATRELRAYRRFQRRAESASTLHELVDMAVTTVMDGLPHITFSGFMSKSATHNRWRHRSVVRPDLADAVNTSVPLDDPSIQKATFEREGLRFVGSSDYEASWNAHLRDRKVNTELRSGFGVRVPLTDGFLGYCCSERGAPNIDNILFLGSLGSILALNMRGSRFTIDEPPAICG